MFRRKNEYDPYRHTSDEVKLFAELLEEEQKIHSEEVERKAQRDAIAEAVEAIESKHSQTKQEQIVEIPSEVQEQYKISKITTESNEDLSDRSFIKGSIKLRPYPREVLHLQSFSSEILYILERIPTKRKITAGCRRTPVDNPYFYNFISYSIRTGGCTLIIKLHEKPGRSEPAFCLLQNNTFLYNTENNTTMVYDLSATNVMEIKDKLLLKTVITASEYFIALSHDGNVINVYELTSNIPEVVCRALTGREAEFQPSFSILFARKIIYIQQGKHSFCTYTFNLTPTEDKWLTDFYQNHKIIFTCEHLFGPYAFLCAQDHNQVTRSYIWDTITNELYYGNENGTHWNVKSVVNDKNFFITQGSYEQEEDLFWWNISESVAYPFYVGKVDWFDVSGEGLVIFQKEGKIGWKALPHLLLSVKDIQKVFWEEKRIPENVSKIISSYAKIGLFKAPPEIDLGEEMDECLQESFQSITSCFRQCFCI